MTRMIYLAYPIDQANASSPAMQAFFNMVEQTKNMIFSIGVADIAFDPGDAFRLRGSAGIGPEIAAINAYAAGTASAVLAFLPEGVPTVGVPMEVDRAVRSGKRTAVLTDAKAWMLTYQHANFHLFPLNDTGARAALAWLSGDDEDLGPDSQDPLPVVVEEGARLPTRGYPDDAGLDLYVRGRHGIPAGSFYDLPCGVSIELPEWGWGLLTGRSSSLRNKGLLVNQAVIDVGYRGPMFTGVWNLLHHTVWVEDGERVAQLIVLPNTTKDLRPVVAEALNPSERGTNGFGSTGA